MFAPAALDSVKQFLTTCLFALTILVCMYTPVYLAHYIFRTDFHFWDWCIKRTAFSIRHIWEKTGNAWAAGLTLTLIMMCITAFSANFSSVIMFP